MCCRFKDAPPGDGPKAGETNHNYCTLTVPVASIVYCIYCNVCVRPPVLVFSVRVSNLVSEAKKQAKRSAPAPKIEKPPIPNDFWGKVQRKTGKGRGCGA